MAKVLHADPRHHDPHPCRHAGEHNKRRVVADDGQGGVVLELGRRVRRLAHIPRPAPHAQARPHAHHEHDPRQRQDRPPPPLRLGVVVLRRRRRCATERWRRGAGVWGAAARGACAGWVRCWWRLEGGLRGEREPVVVGGGAGVWVACDWGGYGAGWALMKVFFQGGGYVDAEWWRLGQ